MSWDFGMRCRQTRQDLEAARALLRKNGYAHAASIIEEAEVRDQYREYEANYTYNVSEMFYDAFGGDGIRGLNGLLGHECQPLLDAAIAKMQAEPEKYRAMNPDNGWGNYEGALELLLTLRSWCVNSPMAEMYIT